MASMHAGAQPGIMLAFNLPMSRACATECVTALKKLGGHFWAAYLTVVWATSAAEAVDWSAELGAHSASLFLGQGLLG